MVETASVSLAAALSRQIDHSLNSRGIRGVVAFFSRDVLGWFENPTLEYAVLSAERSAPRVLIAHLASR